MPIDNDGVMNALDRVEKKFDATITDVRTLIHKHNDTLYGNGRKGLVTSVEILERDVSELSDREDSKFKRRMGLAYSILGSVIGAIILYYIFGVV